MEKGERHFIMELFIDFETTSNANIKDVGAVAYAKHESTRILCMAYAFADSDVQMWKADEEFPVEIVEHVESGGLVSAWNVGFERAIIENCEGWTVEVHPDQYRCTMSRAARMGLPTTLKNAAKAIGTTLKDEEGARAMRIVSNLDKLNGLADDKKEQLMQITYDYCKQDVRVEREIARSIPYLSDSEMRVWKLDQKINFRGLPIDRDLCVSVVDSLKDYMDKAVARVPNITDGEVERPTQVARIKKFCGDRGVTLDNLQADTLADILATDLPEDVRELLEIRQKTSLASTAKYSKMLQMSPDGRAYGTLKYYGAATGRWSGRGLQPQNLPRPADQSAVEGLVGLFKAGKSDEISDVYTAAKSCLRAAICAPEGYKFVVLDYSGIEARVLAWLAGDEETCEKMRNGVDLYKDMASDIYSVPISEVTSEQRQVGKAAILGLGYQMGARKFHGELQRIDESYTEQQAQVIVEAYRKKYAKNVRLWYHLANTAKEVSENWSLYGPWNRYQLPSGRHLHYYGMKMGRDGMTYMKTVPSRGGKMYSTSIYAGKYCENVVQAIARDVLASAMLRIDEAGYNIVSTVHDEVVVLARDEDAEKTFEDMKRIMTEGRQWSEGLPLNVEGYISQRFKK